MQGWRVKLSSGCLGKRSGNCDHGNLEEAKVKEALQIPETESVSALIALGYPEEVPEAQKRKKQNYC